jgi:hypothetical protein
MRRKLLLAPVGLIACLVLSACQEGRYSEAGRPATRSVNPAAAAPAIAGAAAPAKPVAAATAEDFSGPVVVAPRWVRGDRWVYSDGYGLQVVGVEGDITRFRRLDDPGQWFTRHGFLRQEAQSSTAHRRVVFRSIDAAEARTLQMRRPVVFTREYTSNQEPRVHRTSWILEGRETITVPAGTFDTWVIVMRTRNAATNWTGFERWWYSPEVRNYVRLEYRYGKHPVSSRVLMDFSPGEARQARLSLSE